MIYYRAFLAEYRALLIEYRALLHHKKDANTYVRASTFQRDLTRTHSGYQR